MKGARKMSRQKLIQQVMRAMLTALVLVGCGAPASTSTLVLPTTTPTPILSTDTPIPPSDTPIPPSDTPIPVESPQIETGTFDFEGHKRTFLVFLPKNYTDTMKFPLVIYLHSYGWTARQGMNYTQLNQVADANDFMVVYPNAVGNWNSGIGEHLLFTTPNVNDVGFIDGLIDTLSNHYSIDLERIYATGYSNGGFMSYKLACQLSHRIAAIAPVGGVISTKTLEECNPVREVPVLHIHGTDDPFISTEGSKNFQSIDQTLSYWTDFNNCDISDTTILQDLDPTDGSTVEKISYTNCTNNSNVIYYKVINGGHTWPGAGPPGYSAGITNQDFNAGVEIWNFFKDYQLTPTSIESQENDGNP
jgi:polyhydroxybutyrate depolymerase